MIPEPGRVVAGRFRLVGELGNGNMGSVWLADHLGLGVRCAVKLMAHAAMREPSSRARFQLEAKAIARLQSPHIVRVLDYDVDDDTPFIAMELLQGEELAARLARLGPLDPVTTVALVAAIARGLSKAHAVGIVHRDLKPENIFLALTDEGEVVKILDFGIAKVTSPGAGSGTLAGQILGTPQYMSPEQVRGATTIDHRSDLWSLAVVTYQCLLGQLPFDSPTLGDVFAQILVDPIPVPSQAAPAGVWVPRGFDGWWARAVSRDVDCRFGSAREMVEALARALVDDKADDLPGAADITTPPIAIAPNAAEDASVELPMRSRWPSTLIAAAALAGIVALVAPGHLQSIRRAAARFQAPGVVAVAATTATPAVLDPPRPPEASPALLATAPTLMLAPAMGPNTPRASTTPHARTVLSARPTRPPPTVARVFEPVPLASERPPALAPPSAPPAPRPPDDVDFGI
ncbi:MAG: serine/threonine-protein kinase [Polyangiaceae bacterium]